MTIVTTAQDELVDLVTRYNSTRNILTDLEYRASNPICGKPGRGHKAARKLQPQIITWQLRLADRRAAIEVWIARNGKASQIERTRRLARVKALIPNY